MKPQNFSTHVAVLMLIGLVKAGMAGHFVYDTTTGLTMTIGVLLTANPTIDGVPLGMNDEIGVFNTSGLCAGSMVKSWDSTHNRYLRIFGDKTSTPAVDGMKAGDTLVLRVWDFSAQKELRASYLPYPILYQNNGILTLQGLSALSDPDQPVQSSPANGAAAGTSSLSFSWNPAARAASYTVQVSSESAFTTTMLNQSGITGTTMSVSGPAATGTWFWRVNASNTLGATGNWSGVWSFSTGIVPVIFRSSLGSGWNMVSFNIHPMDSSTDAVFGDSLLSGTGGHFFLVKNLYGSVYCPALGISGSGGGVLDTVHIGAGYQVYTDASADIRSQGTAVNAPATPLALAKGWNLIGYLPQSSMPIGTALSGIVSSVNMIKDNDGEIYWPAFGIDDIGTMKVGAGYYAHLKSATTLIYPAQASGKRQAGSPLLRLPRARYFAGCRNTGAGASILATSVSVNGATAPDRSEIGAFNEDGRLVGCGTVMHGLAAFQVWGDDPQTREKDGCAASEKISFRLWDGDQEQPIEFHADNGAPATYADLGVLSGRFEAKAGPAAGGFDLSKAYPNPFRGRLSIEFDVPSTGAAVGQAVEIGVYAMNGALVRQLAQGRFQAGHHAITWECSEGGSLGPGSYVIRMKTNGFEKRMKVVKIK